VGGQDGAQSGDRCTHRRCAKGTPHFKPAKEAGGRLNRTQSGPLVGAKNPSRLVIAAEALSSQISSGPPIAQQQALRFRPKTEALPGQALLIGGRRG
jgi:hypothetical protein